MNFELSPRNAKIILALLIILPILTLFFMGLNSLLFNDQTLDESANLRLINNRRENVVILEPKSGEDNWSISEIDQILSENNISEDQVLTDIPGVLLGKEEQIPNDVIESEIFDSEAANQQAELEQELFNGSAHSE